MNRFFAALCAAGLALLFACSSAKLPPSSSAVTSGASSAAVSSELPSSEAPASSQEDVSSESAASVPSSRAASSRPPSAASTVPGQDSQPEAAQTVTLTFPEGFTLSQVGDRLQAHGVCKKADFVKAAQTYDFNYYSLVKAIPSDPHRAYKLEGYLYPDTYQLYVNMKPQDAVGRFLRNAQKRIAGYSYSGMTTDQVVTLASIIEREADDAENMKKVSAVFHNRLKQGMILQADSTRDYCNNYLIPVFGDQYKYYYNTYPGRAKALPAGPICNPGAAALQAAAHPASVDYLYFATGTNHKYYYGKTQEERDAQMTADGVTPLYKD